MWVDSVWQAAVGETSALRFDAPDCVGKDCGADSTARAYETTVPAAGLVSVSEKILSYEQGAAHPEVDLKQRNWWLSRAGKVKLEEIFTGTAWKQVIAKAARAYVKSQNELVEVDNDSIASVCTVDEWQLTAKALVFTVDGSVFNLGRSMADVEVPWKHFGASLRPEFATALGLR